MRYRKSLTTFQPGGNMAEWLGHWVWNLGDPDFKSRSDHPRDLLQKVIKTLLENNHLGNGDYFVIISSSSHLYCWQNTLQMNL